MNKGTKTIVYDEALRLEAYRFQGVIQPFPSHFHEHYVLGLIEGGERALVCKGQEYALTRGDILLFCPGDAHACVQCGEGTLDYRCLNLGKAVMLDLAEELTGGRALPGFSRPVIRDEEAACTLRALHEMVMSGSREFGKEENLLLLLSILLRRYGRPFAESLPECPEELARACAFMETHYAEHISLDQLCRCTGLSKSTLLRAFTRAKGMTPYRYLEAVRVSEAKKLLEQGASPLEAALAAGFSDQSHFTGYFSRFIGLSPGAYREIFLSRDKDGGGSHA